MFNKEKPVKVTIDEEKCTKCGICTTKCSGHYIQLKDNEIIENHDAFMGCIQCGNCMMFCPNNAISIEGEGISKENIIHFPAEKTDYERLYSLLLQRRSIRKYQDKKIPKDVIEKVMQAATTGPLSIPPFEVKVLVINNKNKVQELADEIVTAIKKMVKMLDFITLPIFSPFVGKLQQKLFKDFVNPLMKITINQAEAGNDILFYNAPAVMIFYTSKIYGETDSVIAATLATIAAESLGLGSCIIGTDTPILNNSVELKKKYGIAKDEKATISLILGYPEEKTTKGIKREFKEVNYIE